MESSMGAYLCISTKPGADYDVVKSLKDKLTGVRPFRVYGPYNIIVKVKGQNWQDLENKLKIVRQISSESPYSDIKKSDLFMIFNETPNTKVLENSKNYFHTVDLPPSGLRADTAEVPDLEAKQRKGPDAFLFIKAEPKLQEKVQNEILRLSFRHPSTLISASAVAGTYDIIAELYTDNPVENLQEICDNFNTVVGLKEQLPMIVAKNGYDDSAKRIAPGIATAKVKTPESEPKTQD